MLPRLWLYLSYDGSAFEGWQKQPHGRTVQDKIEHALFCLTKQQIKTHGCGRTDAGVHADAYAVCADLIDSELANMGASYWLFQLRKYLPDEIRVWRAETRTDGLHCRFSASRRVYEMRLLWGQRPALTERKYITVLPGSLDWSLWVAAWRSFLGEHDFTGFTKKDEGRGWIFDVELKDPGDSMQLQQEFGQAEVRIVGNRFLRRQVRNMVGAAAAVAAGELELDTLREVLSTGERINQIRAVDPEGLRLAGLCYDFGWVLPPKEQRCTWWEDPWLHVQKL